MYKIVENTLIAKDVYKMILAGDTSRITAPGQFVNISLPGHYLRRPISVCDAENNTLTLVYKTVGKGTRAMSAMTAGDTLDILTGLGNGFDTRASGELPVIIGGGVGVPPLYLLTKRLIKEGKMPTVVLGFNSKEDVFFEEEFRALRVQIFVATVDGSYGSKGFVTDIMPKDYTYFYTCGPEAMLKAVYAKSVTAGQLSFEERMGCGFGACMGCSHKTKDSYKRVCKDGPVFEKEEILWI